MEICATPKSRNWRTKLSALLLLLTITATLLILGPTSAHAQGGVPLWTNRYAGGLSGPAIDNAGNVFVTSESWDGTNSNFVMIKYSNSGVPLWTNNNTAGSGAMAVDSGGNVFVTGGATIKYSNAGVPLWTNNTAFGDAIAVDSSGNVFVTGRSGDPWDYATIAYSNAGVPLWTNRYDGANSFFDNSSAIAVDATGNVFVMGWSSDGSTIFDFATVAYSNAGVPLWTNRYSGPGNIWHHATAMAVDRSGNVFVTGGSPANYDNPPKLDYATIAYSNSGEPLWTNRYNPGGLYTSSSTAIAVDSSGNVFVTGSSYNSSTLNNNFVTIKLSSAGALMWARAYAVRDVSNEERNSIAVDASGNVIVAGWSFTAGIGANIGTTIAYSSAGVPLWTNRFSGFIGKMALDRRGNVFVTGESFGATNYYVTIKYSSSIPLPHLDFQKLNNQLVLNWTNANFTLQSAPAVTGTFTNMPAATSPYTNSLTGPQQFFRLISN